MLPNMLLGLVGGKRTWPVTQGPSAPARDRAGPEAAEKRRFTRVLFAVLPLVAGWQVDKKDGMSADLSGSGGMV